MRLKEAVRRYVQWKYDFGYSFEHGSRTLRTLSQFFPDTELERVGAEEILIFLNRPLLSAATWRAKYWVLLRFFEHWSNRGELAHFLMPTPKAVGPRTFVPRVLTKPEVRALLLATSQSHNTRRKIAPQTLRAMILFLYGTGASVGEIVGLKLSDFDGKNGFVQLSSTRPARARRLPLGKDLLTVLQDLVETRPILDRRESYLFESRLGKPITNPRFAWQFRRLRKLAGIRKREGSKHDPRIDDLRYTFAVHRITAWIEEGRDLNRMLPALAAYMGQVGLGSTERYLYLTPEKFREDIDKLSPIHGRGKWSENSDLMRFLSSV